MIPRHALAVTVVAAFIGCLAQHSFATEQEQDLLVLEGARYYTDSLPSLAECLPGVTIPKFVMLTTANYKGYRATWAVISSQLFLIGVEGKIAKTEGNRMHSTPELFPELTFPHKVTTFSGKIDLEGRHLDYVVKGKRITYTDKLTLQFKDGRVVDVSRTTHDEELK